MIVVCMCHTHVVLCICDTRWFVWVLVFALANGYLLKLSSGERIDGIIANMLNNIVLVFKYVKML